MWNLFFGRKVIRFSASLLLATVITALAGCGGGSPSSGTGTVVATPTPTPVAAFLDLSALPTTVKSDASTSAKITVATLNDVHAAISGIVVTLGTDTGVLGSATVTTDATGTATATFFSGGDRTNRTATITATSGSVTTQLPVQVVGSTTALTSTGTALPDDGSSPVTVTVITKDAAGNVVPKAAVALTKTGTGNVTITPASGETDSTGTFIAKVAGAAGGSGKATVTATALGAKETVDVTVTPTAATFAIDQLKLNGAVVPIAATTAMKIGDSLQVRVNAPTSTSVAFATTTGVWNGSTAVVFAPVVAGKATATLTTAQAGIASVQVQDAAKSATSASLTVAMTSASPAYITLQASPSVVSRSVGTTTGASVLIAKVFDANGFPVGDAPVAFRIVNPTGGGESLASPLVLTAATQSGGLNLGEARTSFASGSSSSSAGGVQIRASVVGTTIETEPVGVNLTASGNDAEVVIGGTAGSVAFGQATVLSEGPNLTTYTLAMSVLVADSNGNPAPEGTVVNLSAWPIAWSTGGGCLRDDDDGISRGTFKNEDTNENLILDATEDGTRTYYFPPNASATGAGSVDGKSTPPNSAGGTLPATVKTDKNGVGTFDLTYTKTSAIWTITRIRGRTVVQGTDAVGEVTFRLDALKKDADPCLLPPSPYKF